MAQTFYETLALAAFALLGLWWVVVAERRREWAALPYRRRQAYTVSLYFTLTGIMSLVSLISAVSGIHLHDYGCTLKAYRRQALQGVQLYGEMHRFIPIYAYWNGARVTEIPVRHHARRHGVSHYNLKRIPKVLFDLLVVVFLHRFAQRPMYIFGGVGLINFGIGVIAGGAALYYKFFGHKSFITTPLPLLFVMAFITGVMCFLMGLLAELLVRTYYESQNKATYMISYAGAEQDGDGLSRASERPAAQAFPRS